MTAPIYVKGERIVRRAYRRQQWLAGFCAAVLIATAALTLLTLLALTAWSIKAVIG